MEGNFWKCFEKAFLIFFPNDEDGLCVSFQTSLSRKLVKKLATIRKMVSMDIGPFILENIDARISWLMINVDGCFFMHLCSSCFSKASLSSYRTNTRFFSIFILSGRIEKKWRYCIFLQWWYNTRKTF